MCGTTPENYAIRDFVSSVIRSFAGQNDFPDPSEFKEPFPPKGGYLTKFEFDVTQDGIPELCLRSSLTDKLNIYDTSVFPPRLIADKITLGSDFGVIKDNDSLTLISCKGTTRFRQGFVRRSFRFKKSGEYTTEEFKIDFEAYEKLREQVDQSLNNGGGNLNELLLGTKDVFEIRSANQLLLAAYLKDRLSQWNSMIYVSGYGLLLERSVYTTHSDGSGYIDPELDNDRRSAVNCSLSAARSWLESLKSKDPDIQNTEQNLEPRLPRSSQTPRAKPVSASPSYGPTLSTPMITLVSVIMTGVSVLLWLFLKNRK